GGERGRREQLRARDRRRRLRLLNASFDGAASRSTPHHSPETRSQAGRRAASAPAASPWPSPGVPLLAGVPPFVARDLVAGARVGANVLPPHGLFVLLVGLHPGGAQVLLDLVEGGAVVLRVAAGEVAELI